MSVPSVAGRPVPEFGEVTIPMPPPQGFTADDLDRIPDLPPHTELIDGSLVLVSPQKLFHTLVLELLGDALKAHLPSGLRVAREFSVRLGERQRPEPDLTPVRADAFARLEQAWFPLKRWNSRSRSSRRSR